LLARPVGSADTCNLHCEYTTITQCRSGDGCCPEGCMNSTDNDCSTTCGNGAIDKGETCEANSERPCPASCDDGDPCTKDERTGSIQNCNVVCTNAPITQAVSGDKCCLPGISANVDSDCAAVCGNRLVERDEQCDDGNGTTGDGCDHCKIESQQKICSAHFGGNDTCAKCTCTKCTDQAIACYGNRDQHEAELCRNLVQCSLQTKCSNPDCLCGSASLFSCLAGGGNGPCKKQIYEAAESDSLIDIDARATDPMFPLGLGNTLHTCIVRNCANECDAPQ
jgi:cysteine-rich repeat protein